MDQTLQFIVLVLGGFCLNYVSALPKPDVGIALWDSIQDIVSILGFVGSLDYLTHCKSVRILYPQALCVLALLIYASTRMIRVMNMIIQSPFFDRINKRQGVV
jgi:hypothetical protein